MQTTEVAVKSLHFMIGTGTLTSLGPNSNPHGGDILSISNDSVRQRSGFTLVELLVVITIIGILMGLLIPAVNNARETARKSQCATQIKNLSLAAIQYENTKNEYPGYISRFEDFDGGPDPADPGNSGGSVSQHPKRGTWAITLFPWLDQQAIYEIWTEARYPVRSDGSGEYPNTEEGYSSVATPNIALMQCPSSPVTSGEYGRNNYISNNGMHVLRTSPLTTGPSSGTTITYEDSMDKANGVFNNKFTLGHGPSNPQDMVELGPTVRGDDLKDGLGNTVLFSENLQAAPWYLHELYSPSWTRWMTMTGSTGKWHAHKFFQSRYIHGMVWHWEDDSNINGAPSVDPVHLINGGNPLVDEMTATNCVDLARPSSAHVDGVNMAFADGRVKFVTDSINYRVYQALLTPRGKSSDIPWPEFVLQDDDY